MIKLSTGADSTLGEYKKLCVTFFGAESAPTKFIEAKIAESPDGELEEVIADERQMIMLLGSMLDYADGGVVEPSPQKLMGE